MVVGGDGDGDDDNKNGDGDDDNKNGDGDDDDDDDVGWKGGQNHRNVCFIFTPQVPHGLHPSIRGPWP